MSSLYALIKIYLLNLVRYNRFKVSSKKERAKIIRSMLLIFFAFSFLMLYEFALCFYLADMLVETNTLELLLVLGLTTGTFATFCTSLYKSSSYLFQSNDYNILFSLPIKQTTVLFSRILMLMLDNYLVAIDCILIPCIVYFIKSNTSGLYFPILIILMFAALLIPTVLSLIIIFIISKFSLRKRNHNFALLIFNLMLIIVTLLISFNIQNIITNLATNSSLIIDMLMSTYPLTYYFVDALKNLNVLSLCIFILVSIIPMIAFVLICSKEFIKINERLNEVYQPSNYVVGNLKKSNRITSLLFKELKKYVSSRVYILNTIIFIIFLLVLTLSIVFMGFEQVLNLLELEIDTSIMEMQIFGIVIFTIIMSNTSSVSISIEGKNLWLLKSLPISIKEIFKVKVLFNVLLNLPITIAVFLILGIKLNFELTSMIIAIPSLGIISIFSAILGLYINLHYPNLNFSNDVQVVKQSISVVISMIANILYLFFIGFVACVFHISSFINFLILLNILTFIAIFILCILLKNKGRKLFEDLN